MKPQFGRQPHSLIDSGKWAKLSWRSKAVLPVLLRHAEYTTGESFPSRRSIAIESGLKSSKDVSRATRELEEAGLLTKKISNPKGRQRFTTYVLLLEQRGQGVGASRAPTPVAGDVPVQGHEVPAPQGPQKPYRSRDREVEIAEASRSEWAETAFVQLWTEFPAHRRDAKKSCCDLYHQKVKDEATSNRVLAALRRDKRSADWTKEDGAYVPGMAKWLDREPWNVSNGNGAPRNGESSKVPTWKLNADDVAEGRSTLTPLMKLVKDAASKRQMPNVGKA